MLYELGCLSSVCSGFIHRPFIYQPLSIAARSRIGVANMARQRVLTVASASGVVCSSISETSSVVSPSHTSHSMLGHSTPVSYTAPHTRPATGIGTSQQIHDVSRLLNTPSEYHKICCDLYILYFIGDRLEGCGVLFSVLKKSTVLWNFPFHFYFTFLVVAVVVNCADIALLTFFFFFG